MKTMVKLVISVLVIFYLITLKHKKHKRPKNIFIVDSLTKQYKSIKNLAKIMLLHFL